MHKQRVGFSFINDNPDLKRNLARLALILVMAFLPGLIITIIIPLQTGVPITNFFPISPSDQNEYWHQIATFRLVGFNGGYYTHLENPAIIAASKFGVHGPFYIVVLGFLARITGWAYSTPIFYNIFFIALGFATFAWFSKLNTKQIILAGFSIAFFPSVLIYLPTAMMESTHQMAAMVIALFFGIALVQQEKSNRWIKTAAVIFTLAVSLSRPSWILLLFPMLALFFPKTLKDQVKGLGLSLGCTIVVVILLGLFITPGNNTIAQATGQFSTGLRTGFSYLFRTIKSNLDLFFHSFSFPQMVFRIEYMSILILSFGGIIYYRIKRDKNQKQNLFENIEFRLSLLIFLIIFPIIVWSFTLYFMKNDIRFIAPYAILTIFLLIIFNKEKFVMAFILLNLLAFPSVMNQFTNSAGSNYLFSQTQIDRTRQVMKENIHYEPDQSNAWCNTILIPVTLYDYRVALIPPGIGVSYVLDNIGVEKVIFPVKSKYLLLTLDQMKEIGNTNLDNLQTLATLPDSTLFLNKLASCS